jgi:hypothetical protein
VVGLSKRGGRKESRTELFVDSRGSETEGRSELPVVFSDTIFTEGLRNMQFQNEYGDAVRSTMEDFAFLVPKDQSGEFAYSIRNNGDGSVTIEAHSDFIPIDQAGDGESVAQGKTNLSEGLEARVLNVESEEFLGKEANRGTMQADTQNTSAFAVGFDQTKDKSGVADLVKRGVSLISAHIDRAKAEAIEATLIRMALEEAKGMKDGDIGYITVYQTLLSPDSTLGNPLVFSDMFLGKYESRDGSLKRFVEKQRLVDFLNSSFKKDAPLKNSVRNLLEGGTGHRS